MVSEYYYYSFPRYVNTKPIPKGLSDVLQQDGGGGVGHCLGLKTVVAVISNSFEEQLHATNAFFGATSPLVAEGIVTLHHRLKEGHALDCLVALDEKLGDHLLGLDEAPASQVGR